MVPVYTEQEGACVCLAAEHPLPAYRSANSSQGWQGASLLCASSAAVPVHGQHRPGDTVAAPYKPMISQFQPLTCSCLPLLLP